MARILLGVTGGIAAYKSLEFTRLAMKAGHGVRVIQTEASTRFVGSASFAGITGAPVLLDEFARDPMRGAFPGQPQPEHEPLSHLELVHNADVFLIAPLSANTLAKLAAGLADNLLTTAALACRKPLVVAPAMNDAMWDHAATQDNVARLRARGVTVLEPGTGALGSIGEHGAGRLPEPPELLAAVEAALAPRDLEGLEVLVTAGGTREPIDAVRFVGNRSSGRMGFALADEAARRGARVTVVAANVSLPRNPAVEYVEVQTAAELRDACAQAFPRADILLMAAAVADYRPAQAAAGKIKKDAQGEALDLALERTVDVLSELSAHRRDDQTLVGFAAESGEGAVEYGREKLRRKGLDAVVVNDISAPGIGFDTPENAVTIVTAGGDRPVPRGAKAEIARAVLDMVVAERSSSTQVRV
jgi:phosphopantothenoylcysteine decarboxylase/phosphopantothenate--cysteine ligase